MTPRRTRVAIRQLPVVEAFPTQLPLALRWPDPIERPEAQQPPRDPEAAVLRVMARRRAAA